MRYLLADTHFGHKNLIDKMGRALTSEEHDGLILESINKIVTRSDYFYILGDFALVDIAGFRKQIKCPNLYLILGNHDRLKSSDYGLFTQVCEVKEIKLGPVGGHGEEYRCYLSHYPAAYWPASHYGSLHCYGHLHDAREETLDSVFPGRRSMDVGVDSALRILGEPRPFSELEILDILLSRPGHDPVSWYRERHEARRALVSEPISRGNGALEGAGDQKSKILTP